VAKAQPAPLKPVGVTDDGAALLLARRAGAKGAFSLPIDAALVAALEEARSKFGPSSYIRQESRLTPREIQALLRRGLSVEEVARRAGVDIAWVERFEGPILWERSGMVERAQKAMMSRPRLGASALPLGEAVAAKLRSRRQSRDNLGERWDCVRAAKGRNWVVRFAVSGGRHAEWEFDPATNQLLALNDLGQELGFVQRRSRRARKS
jgi:transcriptional regulator with XRE-family HTH domain